VKDAQHDEPLAVEPILEHVGGIQGLQNDLTILLAPFDGPSQEGMLQQDLRLFDDFGSDDFGKPGILPLQK
jgi:hypothetical protein